MEFSFTPALGFLAGTLTTLAFYPQFHQAWKTRRTRDISLTMYLLFSLGVLLWIVYGFLLHSAPIVIANLFTLALAMGIIFLKIKNT